MYEVLQENWSMKIYMSFVLFLGGLWLTPALRCPL